MTMREAPLWAMLAAFWASVVLLSGTLAGIGLAVAYLVAMARCMWVVLSGVSKDDDDEDDDDYEDWGGGNKPNEPCDPWWPSGVARDDLLVR